VYIFGLNCLPIFLIDLGTSKYEDNIDVLKELSSTLQEEQLDILPNQQVESDRKCIDLEKPSTSE